MQQRLQIVIDFKTCAHATYTHTLNVVRRTRSKAQIACNLYSAHSLHRHITPTWARNDQRQFQSNDPMAINAIRSDFQADWRVSYENSEEINRNSFISMQPITQTLYIPCMACIWNHFSNGFVVLHSKKTESLLISFLRLELYKH